MGPDNEDALCAFLRERLRSWEAGLNSFKPLADTGNYPGGEEISEALGLIGPLFACDESYKFIERFNERKDDLLDLADSFHNLEQFYENQKPTWEKLRSAHERFQLNRSELEQDEKAAPALRRMYEILSAPEPYAVIHEAEGLYGAVDEVNTALASQRRAEVVARIDGHIAEIMKELKAAKGDDGLRTVCLGPLAKLRQQVERIESIAHLTQAEHEAGGAADAAMNKIEEFAAQAETPQKTAVKPRCIVKPTELVGTSYLETEGDIERFLADLRQKLQAAIASGQRIQIR